MAKIKLGPLLEQALGKMAIVVFRLAHTSEMIPDISNLQCGEAQTAYSTWQSPIISKGMI